MIGTVDVRPTAIACQVSDDVGATKRTSAPIIKVDATSASFASAIIASAIAVIVSAAAPVVLLVPWLVLVSFLRVRCLSRPIPRIAIYSLLPWKLYLGLCVPDANRSLC